MNRDWMKFIGVMIFFMIGMIVMLVNHIHQWWVWAIYFTVWTYSEIKIAKNIHLKWWAWALIILGLSIIDYIVYQYVN